MKIVTLIENTCGQHECISEHGLSLYIETKKHKILLDTGASSNFIYNAIKLGIDLKEIDIAVISHGHYDHTGGLLEFAQINSHAHIYVRENINGDFYHGDKYIGIDQRIMDLPQLYLVKGDLYIDEELSLFTNVVARKFYPQSNYALSQVIDGVKQQDAFLHEQYLVIMLEEKSILLSGCAHNGILNILDKYQSIYHKMPDVVISGFHMKKKTAYNEDEIKVIQETANQLSQLDTIFYTGHCTGETAFEIMHKIMGEKLRYIHSGDEVKIE